MSSRKLLYLSLTCSISLHVLAGFFFPKFLPPQLPEAVSLQHTLLVNFGPNASSVSHADTVPSSKPSFSPTMQAEKERSRTELNSQGTLPTPDYYFQRNQLSIAPRILDNTDFYEVYTAKIEKDAQFTATLFINEFGSIDRVELTNHDLSEELVKRFEKSLSRLRFKQGEVNGSAVKSRIVIEITMKKDDSSQQ